MEDSGISQLHLRQLRSIDSEFPRRSFAHLAVGEQPQGGELPGQSGIEVGKPGSGIQLEEIALPFHLYGEEGDAQPPEERQGDRSGDIDSGRGDLRPRSFRKGLQQLRFLRRTQRDVLQQDEEGVRREKDHPSQKEGGQQKKEEKPHTRLP
jgi:hypothetical protein